MSDGLSDAETAELLAHIESCPECKMELDILKSIISASASLPQIEVPDGLKASVFEKLESSMQATTPKRYKFKRFASVAISAAACIALSIGAFSGGLYDKFVASDDIISSGEVNPAPVQTNTEQAETTENTEPTTTPTNVAPDIPKQATTAKKPTPQQKAKQGNENVSSSTQNNSTIDNSAPTSDDITVASGSTQVESSVASNSVQTENSVAFDSTQTESSVEYNSVPTENSASDIPSVASATPSRARLIDEPPIVDAEQAENNSEAAARGGSAEAVSRVPASCIVITEDILAFSNEFGVTDDDGELHFELDSDQWQGFLTFAESIGAELNADYSTENNGCVKITICKP